MISEHQGYQFMYLRAGDGPDPQVWLWADLSDFVPNPRVIAGSLIEFLERQASSTT